ncbi:hypothetical protein [Pelomonas sp. Root405]|uniref:hypothetical protein n=1 Tax=Pelomonas sp. Root405 TaxID=1736529 RepID=UPI0012E33039|nr:hypothetical protein [Pelomonas sp. Root405]
MERIMPLLVGWMLLRLSFRLGAELPGIRPGGRVTFFCGARRKSPKKRRSTARDRGAAVSGARKQSLALRADATRCALAAVPMASTTHRPFTPVNAGCTPGYSGNTASLGRRHWGCALVASPERRCFCFPREHGVQPRVERACDVVNGAGDKVKLVHVVLVCGSGPLLW